MQRILDRWTDVRQLMFEAFFTDPCMRYRTEVINGIDFYGLGFSMVRGECVAEGTLRWMQKGEAAAVLITNTSLPDMSGFELARYVRRKKATGESSV